MRREWIEVIGIELFILGIVFMFCAAMWGDKPVKYIYTPDIELVDH